VVDTPVSESVTLRDENVSVERRNVDRPITDADTAFRDRTIEAEEHHEQPVVRKDARVTEEVVLKKSESQRTETVDDSVRHTEVEVEDQRNAQSQGLQGQRQPGQNQTWKK
jgi:stress response protein YsnF